MSFIEVNNMAKKIYTPIVKVAKKLKKDRRTLVSRLERNGYKGIYVSNELCFNLDEKAWEIINAPIKPRCKTAKKNTPVKEEKPIETKAETQQENKAICGNCKYWKENNLNVSLGTTLGYCHFNPPFVVVIDKTKEDATRYVQQPLFPVTIASDWCGRFEVKEEAKQE